MKKYLLTAAGFVLLAAACTREADFSANPEQAPQNAQPALCGSVYVPGEMQVLFDEETAALLEEGVPTKSTPLAQAMDELGILSCERIFPDAGQWEERHREAGLHRWYRVRFSEDVPQTKAGNTLRDLPGVLNANPVLRKTVDALPFNDPIGPRQWHYENNSIPWAYINVVPVWNNYTKGSSNVIVSVVDGGIDLQHEDLSANVLPGGENGSRNFMNGNKGYRIVAHDHGTHVAGTIGAVNNNGKGVVGIAGGDAAAGISGVKLMSCQIFQDGLRGADDEAAIVWGADHGAVITNNSWGYEFTDDKGNYDSQAAAQTHNFYLQPNSGAYADALKSAIDYFNKYAGKDKSGNQTGPMAGGLVLFAAGNEGRPYGAPACYPEVMSVGAINPQGVRSTFSNYGDWVDICAPGVDVYSTLPGNSYGSYDGTSMACPHVAGVAALVVSYCGEDGFTREMLWDKLIGGANSSDFQLSYKIGPLVDAMGAIAYGAGDPPQPVEAYTVDEVVSNNVTLTVTVPADAEGQPAYGFRVLAATSESALLNCDPQRPGDDILRGSFLTGEAKVGDKVTGTIGELGFNKTYYIAVTSFDYGRNYSALSSVSKVKTGSNHAPVITSPIPGNKLDIHIHDRYTLPFTITDPDNHVVNVVFDKDIDDTGFALSLVESVKKDEYLLQVVGNVTPPGTYHAKLMASDNYGLSATVDITYTIFPNQAPVLLKDFENQVIPQEGTLTLDTAEYIKDPDGEILTYSIEISDRRIVHVSQSAESTVLNITALASSGAATVTVTGTDAGGKSVSSSFVALVRPEGVEYQAYPNPVISTLYVGTGLEADDAAIRIVSSTGVTVLETVSTCSAFAPAVIDMSRVAPGLYTLHLNFGGKSYRTNIIKK